MRALGNKKAKPRPKKERLPTGADLPKRPRHYAAEIMRAKGEDRKVMFDAVPEHLQEMVRQHCYNERDRQRAKRKR